MTLFFVIRISLSLPIQFKYSVSGSIKSNKYDCDAINHQSVIKLSTSNISATINFLKTQPTRNYDCNRRYGVPILTEPTYWLKLLRTQPVLLLLPVISRTLIKQKYACASFVSTGRVLWEKRILSMSAFQPECISKTKEESTTQFPKYWK